MRENNPGNHKTTDGREKYRIDCEDCDFSPIARGWIAAKLVEEEHEMTTGHDVDFHEQATFSRATEMRE